MAIVGEVMEHFGSTGYKLRRDSKMRVSILPHGNVLASILFRTGRDEQDGQVARRNRTDFRRRCSVLDVLGPLIVSSFGVAVAGGVCTSVERGRWSCV